MLLLALDTSTRQASVVLCTEETLLGEYAWQVGNNHSVELLERIQRLVTECGQTMQALEAIAVATGPGSFNGLRVALANARDLAVARATRRPLNEPGPVATAMASRACMVWPHSVTRRCMRSSNSTLWLFPTCHAYSPSSVSSMQRATLAWRVDVSRASSNIGVFLELSQHFAIARTNRRKKEAALRVTEHFQTDIEVVCRPVQVGFLSPFHHAHAGAGKILLKAKIKDFFRIIEPVQIKMVQCRSSPGRFAIP